MRDALIRYAAFLLFAGMSTSLYAQGTPGDDQSQGAQSTQATQAGQGTGRQQVMPSMPHRDWHEGDRVPAKYRHYNFVVQDWKSHNLDAPARGQKWLGVNGDYVLVTTSNWKIAKIVEGTP
jgi:Ni/Co efflux regulator RcnB